MNKESKKLFWIAIVIIAILGGGFFAWSTSQTADNTLADAKLLMNSTSHTTEKGTRIYPVTLVEFGDYQCPACGFAEAIVEKILADNPKVKLVFRNFPLAMHKNALLAAEAAEAAGAQGKFWDMHNVLYINQDLWSSAEDPMAVMLEIAKKINVPDLEKFKADVTAKKFASVISKDQQDGNALGVNSTPTFYINGKKYTGKNSLENLQKAIDDAATKEAKPTVP